MSSRPPQQTVPKAKPHCTPSTPRCAFSSAAEAPDQHSKAVIQPHTLPYTNHLRGNPFPEPTHFKSPLERHRVRLKHCPKMGISHIT